MARVLSKYKGIVMTSVLLLVIILMLLLLRCSLDAKTVQAEYIIYYHKHDMDELKKKISAGLCICINGILIETYLISKDLKKCQTQAMELQLDLSWYMKRVEELEIKLKNRSIKHDSNLIDNHPILFLVTPTYKRWTQKADLTRLCQTLMHVSNLKWIVIEDSDKKTPLVTKFLSRCPVNSTHLFIKTSANLMPTTKKDKSSNKVYIVRKPRGIEQRNIALDWLRNHYKLGDVRGVVYFADDDNTYDLRLFDEMRTTKKVSVWPVGIAGGLKFEGPVCSGNKVKRWYAYWAKDRTFQIDFAGFAINLDLLLKSGVLIPTTSHPGYVENDFLDKLITLDEMEPKANGCKMVLVWHTRTEKPSMFYENQLIKMGHPSNPHIEV